MTREDGRREAVRRFGKPPESGQQIDQKQRDRAAGRAEAARRFGTTTERNER